MLGIDLSVSERRKTLYLGIFEVTKALSDPGSKESGKFWQKFEKVEISSYY